MALFITFPHEKTTFQWPKVVLPLEVCLYWKVVLDFRSGHWKCPNREWGNGHFHLLCLVTALACFARGLENIYCVLQEVSIVKWKQRNISEKWKVCFTYRCWPWKLMPIIFNPNQWKQTNALPTLATLAQQMRMKWGYFAIQSKSLRLEFNSTAIANTFMIVPLSLSNMSNQLNGYWLFPITSIVPEGSSSLNEDHNFPSYPLTSWFTWEVLRLRCYRV